MKTREIKIEIGKLSEAIEGITEPSMSKVISELLNLIEELNSENEEQKQIIENQRAEINKLKGEDSKPDIKANTRDGSDFSCENERKEAESFIEEGKDEGYKLDKVSLEKLKEQRIPCDILEVLGNIKCQRYDSKADFLNAMESEIGVEAVKLHGCLLVKYARYKKRSRIPKVPQISIDRVEKCKVDCEQLPCDAEFKGYKSKVVQDAVIKSDNVRLDREVYWSGSEKKTYMGSIPTGYERDFGPNINSQIISFKYVCNMSIPKIKEFYENIGVIISESYISDRLTKELDVFHTEKADIYEASLAVGDWHQIDDTGSRVNGQNYYTHIVCNDLCTVFFTTLRKDRLTILDILRNFESRSFVFNDEAFAFLKQLNISQKLIEKLAQETQRNKELNEKDMEQLLASVFPEPAKGKINRARIIEAAAIASYHRELGIPVVKVLLSDDAPQFKLIIDDHMLCWIHEGRHYKKLRPVVPLHSRQLTDFRERFWKYYRNLCAYKQKPCFESAQSLSTQFEELFSTKTGYNELDDRISKTRSKKDSLLTVLKHPEIPLHNNQAENGARVQKRREDVSLQTKTDEGTKAKDTMMSIVETCKKFGVSSYQFIKDRISKTFKFPTLGTLIRERAAAKKVPFDSS